MRVSEKNVFFYDDRDEFSQSYRSDFTVKGITFNSMTQYITYAKAKLFKDEDIAQKILDEPQPESQKALGRRVKNFNEDVWNANKEKIVIAGSVHKYSQNSYLQECLMNVGGKNLVEASPDKIWGVGLTEDNYLIDNPKEWKGQNLSGKCIEAARTVLMKNLTAEQKSNLDSTSNKEKSGLLKNRKGDNPSVEQLEFWEGERIESLKENEIFVFGSNPSGIHGAGGAKTAMKFGAKIKNGRGIQGQAYALVTKNLVAGFFEKETGITYVKDGYKSLTEKQIMKNIEDLYDYANANKDKKFMITYQYDTWDNGTPKKGLNGYTSAEMFGFFANTKPIPTNIVFHESYKPKLAALENKQEYTFFFRSTSNFSQWHPSKFEYRGVTFSSAEQFMMYSKAKLFKDEDVAQKILDINSRDMIKDFLDGKLSNTDITQEKKRLMFWDKCQKEIKDLGKQVKNFNESLWLEKRFSIISIASREKFGQNAHLKSAMMACKGTKFVEASPYDKIYGIGLSKEDAMKTPKEKWKGLNLLGDALTNTMNYFENELKEQRNNKPKM